MKTKLKNQENLAILSSKAFEIQKIKNFLSVKIPDDSGGIFP
ncbi:MAG: hypothetical protein AABX16_02430 [Nanoarchaeota archaeon]